MVGALLRTGLGKAPTICWLVMLTLTVITTIRSAPDLGPSHLQSLLVHTPTIPSRGPALYFLETSICGALWDICTNPRDRNAVLFTKDLTFGFCSLE